MLEEKKLSFLLLFVFGLANFLFWVQSHHVQAKWANVPPVPAQDKAGFIALGDNQLAYRFYATMLQNLGNVGGQAISLKTYDYSALKKWFFLADALDPISDVVPMMATYYYAAVKDKQRQYLVLDYLAEIGKRPDGQKWRWLGHAVYIARHELNDNDKALELAYLLAANKSPDLADWAKQMPAFILKAQGQTDLAYKIMLNLLISNVDMMHPNEIFFMKDYICNTLLKENTEITPPDFCNVSK